MNPILSPLDYALNAKNFPRATWLNLPGFSAQGTHLGILCFLGSVNSFGVPLDIGQVIYRSSLILTENNMAKPLNFRDRTGHILRTNNSLQSRVGEIEKFCKIQPMKINEKKTLTAVFNTAKSIDCYPRILNSSGSLFENTEEFKLLGVNFTTDQKLGIRWDPNIKKCIQKAFMNMWKLRRLTESGVSMDDLLMTYTERIRVMVEQNVALWSFSISKFLINAIEKVQKTACFIILGKHSGPSYYCNLAILDLEPLEVRRETLCRTFATKTFKHPVHSSMFTLKKGRSTRSVRKVMITTAKSKQYEDK